MWTNPFLNYFVKGICRKSTLGISSILSLTCYQECKCKFVQDCYRACSQIFYWPQLMMAKHLHRKSYNHKLVLKNKTYIFINKGLFIKVMLKRCTKTHKIIIGISRSTINEHCFLLI